MIVQYSDKRLNRMAIENSLKHNEKIVCENATVIADENGNITGWFNNDIPVCVVTKE